MGSVTNPEARLRAVEDRLEAGAECPRPFVQDRGTKCGCCQGSEDTSPRSIPPHSNAEFKKFSTRGDR